MSVAQQLPVSLTPERSAGYVGAHRAGVASRTTRRMGPWAHRGLAVGTLAAGLWLVGALSQASAAEAAPISAPAAIPTVGVSAPSGAVDLHSTPIAASAASQSTAAVAATITHTKLAKTSLTGSAAAGVVGGLGTLPPARSDAAGATPPAGSSAARRPVSTVVAATAGLARSVPAAPLPAVPVLRTPPLAVPALPGPALALPAVLLPAVLGPALPVVSARPAKPARAVPATQPAAEATATPPATVTERENNTSSNPTPSSTPVPETSGTPVNPPHAPAPPTSAIDPISDHRNSALPVGSGAATDREVALASSGHRLAFTGASVALLEVLGLGLTLAGLALCLVRRRVTA